MTAKAFSKQVKQLLRDAGYIPRQHTTHDLLAPACVGFTTDDSPFEVAALIVEYIDDPTDAPDILRQIERHRTDELSIYYLPRVAWVE